MRRVKRKVPAHRPSSRKTLRRSWTWRARAILAATAAVAVLATWGVLARAFAPKGNTARTRFDTIIVLGSPADAEGNPTPEQLARVTEAVREYERGVAPRLILTGGATRRGYVEANVMARAAEALGVPSSSIFPEPDAMDTIHNACYSARIMQAHGWRSAEVVSSDSQLPRAGLIFSRQPLEWRTHAAPSLEPGSGAWLDALEVLKTMRYLVYASWAEKCG